MFWRKKKESLIFTPVVKEKTNIIQYDEMGYPLRLIITDTGEQMWLDIPIEEISPNDKVLKWTSNII